MFRSLPRSSSCVAGYADQPVDPGMLHDPNIAPDEQRTIHCFRLRRLFPGQTLINHKPSRGPDSPTLSWYSHHSPGVITDTLDSMSLGTSLSGTLSCSDYPSACGVSGVMIQSTIPQWSHFLRQGVFDTLKRFRLQDVNLRQSIL